MMCDVWHMLSSSGVHLHQPTSAFFSEGDDMCDVALVHFVWPEDEDELLHRDVEEFECDACDASFTQIIDFEKHHESKHKHSCNLCPKNFLTDHQLQLHTSECHDKAFFELMRRRKPSFECLVESCRQRFWDAHQRKQHCLDDHSFSVEYDNFMLGNEETTTEAMAIDISAASSEMKPEEIPLVKVEKTSSIKRPLSLVNSRVPRPTWHQNSSANNEEIERRRQNPDSKSAPMSPRRSLIPTLKSRAKPADN